MIKVGGSKLFRLNPNFYTLKSYFKYKSKNYEKVNWLPRVLDPWRSVNQIIDEIVREEVDVLCLSLFVWNFDKNIMIIQKIKKILPNIKIIVGGPSQTANIEDNYFFKYPEVDFAVYGDGEEAFSEILDSIIENRKLSESTVNTVTKDYKYPHKIFRDPEYLHISPILTCKEDIKQDLKYFQDDNIKCVVYWERSRGCPYKCSFCDWSSGLHHKVTRFKTNWQLELDFLFSLNVAVSPGDANWGIFEEDLEITEYAIKKGDFQIVSLAKLQKERAFEIMRIVQRENNKKPKNQIYISKFLSVDLQDIHEDVLAAIDRPDVPWEEHKKLVSDFNKEFPDVYIMSKTIVGMPNQTREKAIRQYFELESAGITHTMTHIWEMLPNSPGYKKEYQEKYGMIIKNLVCVRQEFNNIDELKYAVKNGEPGYTNTDFVIKNNTLDWHDILYVKLLGQMFTFFKKYKDDFKFQVIIDYLEKSIDIESKRIAEYSLTEGVFGVNYLNSEKWGDLEEYFVHDENVNKFLSYYNIANNYQELLEII